MNDTKATVAVVTDSNSGLTMEDAKRLGIYLIPMPFMIEGETYLEGVTLTQKDFFQKLSADLTISTSQPSPADVLAQWDALLKDYDEIIHIPMSSGLSSAMQTATMLAEDYNGKVFVVDNQRISVPQLQSVLHARDLALQGKKAAEITDILMKEKLESSIYITLDTLKYLRKGGRLTPAVAAIGTILRIKPVLQIQGEKLDRYTQARTMTHAKTLMVNALKKDIENRFGGDSSPENIYLFIAHTDNDEAALVFRKELEEIFPDHKGKIYIAPLSLSIACHTGAGALGCAVTARNGAVWDGSELSDSSIYAD